MSRSRHHPCQSLIQRDNLRTVSSRWLCIDQLGIQYTMLHRQHLGAYPVRVGAEGWTRASSLARRSSSWRWGVSRLRPASSVAGRLRYGTAATRTGRPVPTLAPLLGHGAVRCVGGTSRQDAEEGGASARTQALDDS